MAVVDLCTFIHGLGIYIRILPLASAREKIIEYECPNPWLNEHKSTAAMNYFLNTLLHTFVLNVYNMYFLWYDVLVARQITGTGI
jgi:NADH:ubiquinone oxidoreductase subunit 3 (subunit A)